MPPPPPQDSPKPNFFGSIYGILQHSNLPPKKFHGLQSRFDHFQNGGCEKWTFNEKSEKLPSNFSTSLYSAHFMQNYAFEYAEHI